MIDVKVFKDGNRYVVTLESEDNNQCEAVIKDIFSKMVDVNFQVASDSNVVPLEPVEKECPVTLSEASEAPNKDLNDTNTDNSEPVLLEGPYKGKKPLEIVLGDINLNTFVEIVSEQIEDEPKKAFKHLVALKYQRDISKELKKAIGFALVEYLKVYFSQFDYSKLISQFNAEQLFNFFSDLSYGGCIPKVKKIEFIKEYNYEDWNSFIKDIHNNPHTAIEIAVKSIDLFVGKK